MTASEKRHRKRGGTGSSSLFTMFRRWKCSQEAFDRLGQDQTGVGSSRAVLRGPFREDTFALVVDHAAIKPLKEP
jgi:hypothetical protein